MMDRKHYERLYIRSPKGFTSEKNADASLTGWET